MKNTKPKVRLWSVLTGLTAILTVAAIVGNIIANQYATTINVALNASTYKIIHGENTGDTEYFKKGFASDEEREAYEAELCATVEAEGAALLKNENNALPLASGAKVSLFGHGSVDLMYGGTGSGSVDTSKAPNLKQALEAQGITINQTLWDLYSSDSMMSKYSRLTPASISDTLEANTQYAVNEAPWSALSSAESSFAEYGDAAIVVLSRSGGEGADLPSGENGTSDSWISGQEGDGNYLALSAEEIELLKNLKALKDNGTFKNIVVLINSSNAIELDFLNPEICGEDYGIDAAMWIGDVGQTGINGVGQLLSGAVTPSGSLVDTYLYDNMANPAMYNFYTQAYPNAAEYNLLTSKPVIYAANVAEDDLADDGANNSYVQSVREYAKEHNSEVFVICAEIEAEISELEEDEKKMFLEDLGLTESGLEKLIAASYRLLGLMSFLTAGEDETRAWTIKVGTKAPQAAGKIHTDFERGFIKAEVVNYQDLLDCGSYAGAREKGLVRMEGKDYIVRDGDVILFRFNV